MKGAASKPVSRSLERPRAISLTSSGTKSSKYSSPLPTHSQLTKVKSKSSDDLSSKAAGSLTSSSSRLKKTVTMGTIAELTENKAKSSPGSSSSARRSGIPTPRESAILTKDKVPRERSRTLPSKRPGPAVTGCELPPVPRHARPAVRPRAEGEGTATDTTTETERARLEIQVKELLAEAKARDFEMSRLRCELVRQQDRPALSTERTDTPRGNDPEGLSGSPGDVESQLRKLQERDGIFQQELGQLRAEKRVLQERLRSLEHRQSATEADSSLEVSPSTDPGSSLRSPSSLTSTRNPMGEASDSVPSSSGDPSHSSASLSDVTKGTPSPDSLGFDAVFNPSSISSDGLRSATSPSDTSSEGSLRNSSLVSVASLVEKIQQMEEKQHSTAEELQATLQELSDQQQVIQELTAENERLAEEKGSLENSFHQQRERLQRLVSEKERWLSLGQPAENVGSGPELGEGRDPHPDKQPLSNGCPPEPGADALLQSLRDEASNLHRLLEAEQQRNVSMAESLADCRATAEGLCTENRGLRERLALALEQSAREGRGFQEQSRDARSEKEQLEAECAALRERARQAASEVTRLHSLLLKVEREQALSQGRNERRLEEPSFMAQRLRDETSEKESEIKDMKETIFDLQDQVDQHQAIKLHNNRTIEDLGHKVMTLEQQKLELEKQLKMFNKKMKDEAEEWRYFQADLQTAVVVANDIKCEAQQEVRVLRRRLQEVEARIERLQSELDTLQSPRTKNEDLILERLGCDTHTPWQRRSIDRIPPEPSPKVKTLIKSFDSSLPGGANATVRSLSGIPLRTPPAAAVSPMQRPLTSGPCGTAVQGREPRPILSKLPLSGISIGRADGFTSDHYRTPSPSQETISLRTALGFSSKRPDSTSSSPRTLSKLSAERKDPLAALAREYGGSKRNALLKWCQRKTEGYPNIDITNFSSSWSDGLALCALLHTYLPAHIPYQQLSNQDRKRNLTLAFQAAESVGIKSTLDLNDLMCTDRPDWQSLMQYVAQIYRYFES